ncbi:hypothetical protein FNFX1_0959 [Francisella cf. novicida Fx1]|nr:hypothetical protein FNFX1_0959 [Francisella cf. novicida Fx1]
MSWSAPELIFRTGLTSVVISGKPSSSPSENELTGTLSPS